MKAHVYPALLALCCVPLLAQSPAAAPATPSSAQAPAAARVAQSHSSEIGFTYSLPLDWEVMDAQPMLPAVKQQQAETATSEGEKKGISCTQIALLAREGNPARTVVVVVALPFACFGQTMTDKDLPGFAEGVALGLKKSFEISNPLYGAYTLGTHHLWIERAIGSAIGQPEVKRTVETVCAVLKKGAICWIAQAADQEGLQTFESGAVTLDGYSAPALVPAGTLQKNPM